MNIWQIIVIIIIALTVYIIIDNKREARQRRERNAKILPENGCIPLIRPDRLYNVVLSDGKAFCRVAVIGQMQQEVRLGRRLRFTARRRQACVRPSRARALYRRSAGCLPVGGQ